MHAHCIDQQEVDLGFKVRLGAQDISRGDGVLYRIDHIVRHSQYNAASNDVNHPPNMYANDIALVHIVPDGKPAPVNERLIRTIPPEFLTSPEIPRLFASLYTYGLKPTPCTRPFTVIS